MPFRSVFQCLWCGRTHRARSPSDLEGWALLCPGCLGRAGENPFLRFRLRQALADRSREGKAAPDAGSLPDDANGREGDRASAQPAAKGHEGDRASDQPDGKTRDAADAAAGQLDPD